MNGDNLGLAQGAGCSLLKPTEEAQVVKAFVAAWICVCLLFYSIETDHTAFLGLGLAVKTVT
jgi:hypothetical protein